MVLWFPFAFSSTWVKVCFAGVLIRKVWPFQLNCKIHHTGLSGKPDEMPQLTRPHFYELLFLRISNSLLQTKSAPFWELHVLLFSLMVSEVINTSGFVFAQSSKDCKTDHIHWLNSLVSFPLEPRKLSKWVCLFEEGEQWNSRMHLHIWCLLLLPPFYIW